jgi:hypothetical protein
MLPLALSLALLQPAQPTVALIVNGHTRVVSVATAERLAKSSSPRLRPAAEIALATVACTENEAQGLVNTPRGRSCAAQRDAGLL